MTKEERDHRRGTTVPSWLLRQNDMIQGKFNASGSIGDLPSSVDWAAKGACNAPKNQGQCGSCWAFSTIGGVESLNKIKTGTLVSLSEQQLVDCAGAYGGNGCSGGQVPSGSDYSKDNAVCTEADYPYEDSQSTCRSGACKGIVQLKGFNYVESSNEQAMMAAVAENPIIVAIDASGNDFNYYNGGVLTAYCGTGLDHGVLVVGYGTSDEGVDYWKVRNSWGASWGEQGYIRMKRGVSGVGYCGILSIPIQPTM